MARNEFARLAGARLRAFTRPVKKAEVRKLVRERLAALDTESAAAKSAEICAQIAGLPEWHSARTVCLFAPQAHEPDVELLWRERGARTFCYPRVNGVELDLLKIDDPSELQTSRWQLREPIHDPEKLFEPSAIDLLLVPGVAFTRGLLRLGRGGGFYDRLLAREDWRAVSIGICFEEQLLDALPREPHDRPVDRVISA